MLNLINNELVNIITSSNHDVIEKVPAINLSLINGVNGINNESFIGHIELTFSSNGRNHTNNISTHDECAEDTQNDCNLLGEEFINFCTSPDKYKPNNNANDLQWVVDVKVECSIIQDVEIFVVYWRVKHFHYNQAQGQIHDLNDNSLHEEVFTF